MLISFFIFLFLDALIACYLYREAFIVRSNMRAKYRKRLFILLALMGASVALFWTHPTSAYILAGLPAAGVGLFLLVLAIAFARHKGPWH